MKQKIFVFFARSYSFEDAATHALREGVSVNYLVCDALTDVDNGDGSYGYQPCKDSIGLDKLNKLKEVPGFYEAEFTMAPAKGQTRLKLSDLTLIKK